MSTKSTERTVRAARERLHQHLAGMAHPGLARVVEQRAEQRLAEGKLKPADVEAFVRTTKDELAPVVDAFGPPDAGDAWIPKSIREHRGEKTADEEARRTAEAELASFDQATPRQRAARIHAAAIATRMEIDGHAEYARQFQAAVEGRLATDPGFTSDDVPTFLSECTCMPRHVKSLYLDEDPAEVPEEDRVEHPYEDEEDE
jgi:hypothetical protein